MQCPLLCKEFVINVWQIYYARSKGADAILLIAAVLPNIDIAYFLRVSKSLGMTALVEVTFFLRYHFPFTRTFFIIHCQLIIYYINDTIASFQNRGCSGIVYKV
jgi:hypothetical protein